MSLGVKAKPEMLHKFTFVSFMLLVTIHWQFVLSLGEHERCHTRGHGLGRRGGVLQHKWGTKHSSAIEGSFLLAKPAVILVECQVRLERGAWLQLPLKTWLMCGRGFICWLRESLLSSAFLCSAKRDKCEIMTNCGVSFECACPPPPLPPLWGSCYKWTPVVGGSPVQHEIRLQNAN